ncbi:MAG: hypothetical protein RJA98_1171 [Pseudomonadota bacterium]
MKLQPDRTEGVNAVAAFSGTECLIQGKLHRGSLIAPWRGDVQAWACRSVAELRSEDMEALAALAPELVILGTGTKLKFPPSALLQPLMRRRIGFETMDSAAACRTFNVLVGEARSVVLALMVDAD